MAWAFYFAYQLPPAQPWDRIPRHRPYLSREPLQHVIQHLFAQGFFGLPPNNVAPKMAHAACCQPSASGIFVHYLAALGSSFSPSHLDAVPLGAPRLDEPFFYHTWRVVGRPYYSQSTSFDGNCSLLHLSGDVVGALGGLALLLSTAFPLPSVIFALLWVPFVAIGDLSPAILRFLWHLCAWPPIGHAE